MSVLTGIDLLDDLYDIAKNLFGQDVHVIKGHFFLEFVDKNIDKSVGLSVLLNKLDISDIKILYMKIEIYINIIYININKFSIYINLLIFLYMKYLY